MVRTPTESSHGLPSVTICVLIFSALKDNSYTRLGLSKDALHWGSMFIPQFSSVQSLNCLTLWDPMDCSTPGLPVHHQLPESTQTHALWVNDAIQPSHPLSAPSPSALNLSQHQDLFKWVSSPNQVAKVLEFQLQHQSCQWILRTDFL